MKKLQEQINKSPRRKALLFFGFYFVFFAIIIAFLRNSSQTTTNSNSNSNSPLETSLPFEMESLKGKNYQFSYSILVDNEKYEYQGEKENEKEKILFNNESYYYNGEDYLNTSGIKEDNPYIYSEFLSVDILNSLLKNSYFEAKTVYESGKVVYRFLLDTNVIYKTIYNENSDFSTDQNIILVSINQNGQVEEVSYQLNSYCETISSCTTLKINMSYENWGEIKITNPIE